MKIYQKLLTGIMVSAVPFALSATVSTDAQTQANKETLLLLEEKIKTSFIVTFKPINTGVLSLISLGETSEEAAPVAFGESSFTPEFKQKVAQEINLQGEVVHIFGTINAISIKASAEEAERLRGDDRVLDVEQDRIVSAGGVSPNPELALESLNEQAFVRNAPIFNGEVLNIPAVDSLSNLAAYQDVKFKRTEQGLWELLEYKERGLLLGAYSQNVELIVIDTFPVQVYLKLSGEFPTGCSSVGRVDYKLINNVFNVSVFRINLNETARDAEGRVIPIPNDEFRSCTQGFESFEKIIPLPVYSLPAGEYTYNVNDHFTGTFNLQQDNVLP